jgi:hypothetical protein
LNLIEETIRIGDYSLVSQANLEFYFKYLESSFQFLTEKRFSHSDNERNIKTGLLKINYLLGLNEDFAQRVKPWSKSIVFSMAMPVLKEISQEESDNLINIITTSLQARARHL